jgi:hypothetical protein
VNEQVAYVDLSTYDLPTTLIGLEDLNLSGVADATSGSYDIIPQTPTGIFLAANYPAALAQAGAWVATNNSTGLTIPVTSATVQADGKTVIIALPTANANYPTVGLKVNITLAAPAALAALSTPITGFESAGPVSIVRN